MRVFSWIIFIGVMFTMCSSGAEWQSVIDNDHANTMRPTQQEDLSDAGKTEYVTLGIFTDAHYAQKPNSNGRYYSASKQKVKEAAETFNQQNVDIAVSLGDIVDNDYSSYGEIGACIDRLTMPKYQLLGNHDFLNPFVEDRQNAALKLLGITDRYFSIVTNGFRLIFLDSSDIATYSHPFESEKYREAESLLKTLKDDDEANAKKYNGAISERQQAWLKDELEEASIKNETVICLCHIPLATDGADQHTLWNGDDITDLLSSYKCVKAVIAGHHHEGGHSYDGDIHHITLKGMVQGEENSFAIVKIYKDHIIVDGYGREDDKEYKLR